MKNIIFEKHKFETILNITRLVTVHYFEFEKNFIFSGEQHDFWEMVYADKGEIIISADDKDFLLKQGEVYFHCPGEFHKLRANGKIAPNIFVVTFVCSSPAMKFFAKRKMILPQNLKSFLSKVIRETQNAFELSFYDPYHHELKAKEGSLIGAQQLVRIYLETLLILLLREKDEGGNYPVILHSKESVENHITAQIIEYMEKRLYDKISLTEICNIVSYGKTHICRLFKENTGYSLLQYYNILKIAESKRLLREGNLSVTEIAGHLNFSDAGYFARCFKKITKMTPSEYLQSVRATV